MLTVAEARARLLAYFKPLEAEPAPLEAALGRVLAEAVLAGEDLPPFANSSMDGFAVRVVDVAQAASASPVTLRVSGDIPAGAPNPPALIPGTAMRIMTGAPVPAGADAIVPVEETDHADRGPSALPAEVRIFKAPEPGRQCAAGGPGRARRPGGAGGRHAAAAGGGGRVGRARAGAGAGSSPAAGGPALHRRRAA